MIRPKTFIIQDLQHLRDKGVIISYSLEEESGLVNTCISLSHPGKCQGVMIPGTPDWGNKVICEYTGCTLQTFVKHYESTIFPLFFRDSHF